MPLLLHLPLSMYSCVAQVPQSNSFYSLTYMYSSTVFQFRTANYLGCLDVAVSFSFTLSLALAFKAYTLVPTWPRGIRTTHPVSLSVRINSWETCRPRFPVFRFPIIRRSLSRSIGGDSFAITVGRTRSMRPRWMTDGARVE